MTITMTPIPDNDNNEKYSDSKNENDNNDENGDDNNISFPIVKSYTTTCNSLEKTNGKIFVFNFKCIVRI